MHPNQPLQVSSFLGKTAALLLHEIPVTKWHLSLNKMSQDENVFSDQSLLWDCDGCAPPSFNIPPPPRPPWMENPDHCGQDLEDSNTSFESQETLSHWLSQLQTCDNTIIRDPPSVFEDVFHSIAIIVVCAIILVIFILSVGLYVFKRRKTFRECHQRSSEFNNSHHRGPTRYVGNVNPAIDCATPTHLSHTLGPVKQSQILYEGQAITSLTSNGHTMTRCLANHYISDANNHNKMLTLDHRDNLLRKQAIAEEFRQRFGPVPERRNVMELSERPPQVVPTATLQNNNPGVLIGTLSADSQQHAYQVSNASDYPHIVIGGKPFFLVPSSHSPSTVMDTTVNNSEAYAYPQHMPIYEEIDYTTVSAPMSSGSIMMDRPLSSAASHSNSAHTNTSELSSGSGGDSSSSNSSQKIIIDSAIIMPEVSQPGFIPPRHCSTTTSSNSQQNRVRLADGVLRSASPQSPFSARLSGKNQNKAANSNSVYYYSDTIKKPPLQQAGNSSSDDTMSLDIKAFPENTNKVNTKVTLMEEKDTGSTLV